MAKTKRIMSGGLAFAEQKDMDILRKMALKGWNVKRFRGMGYELEKGTPEDVIFSIDYRNLKTEEPDEYFDMFEMAGWEHVCSDETMHIFKAAYGTKPIYTDVETEKDKYTRLQGLIHLPVIISVIMTIALFLVTQVVEGTANKIVHGLFLLMLVLTIPIIFTYGAAMYRRLVVQGLTHLLVIISAIVTIGLFLVTQLVEGTTYTVLNFLFLIMCILTIPLVFTYCVAVYRRLVTK